MIPNITPKFYIRGYTQVVDAQFKRGDYIPHLSLHVSTYLGTYFVGSTSSRYLELADAYNTRGTCLP